MPNYAPERCVHISRFERKLGEGAQGEVWEAQTNDGKTVAVKIFEKLEIEDNDSETAEYIYDSEYEKYYPDAGKLLFNWELKAFEHIKANAPSYLAAYLPQFFGIVPLTASNIKQLENLNVCNALRAQENGRSPIYAYGLAMEVLNGKRKCDTLPPEDESVARAIKETIIWINNELHKIGVCHREVCGLNIMLTGYKENYEYEHYGVVLFDWGTAMVCEFGSPEQVVMNKAAEDGERERCPYCNFDTLKKELEDPWSRRKLRDEPEAENAESEREDDQSL